MCLLDKSNFSDYACLADGVLRLQEDKNVGTAIS